MKKIIEKSYNCLIFVFFALFTLLIRKDANEHFLVFSIGLIVSAILLAIIPFLLNHCKKIEVRRGYLISMIACSVYAISHTTFLLLVSYLNMSNEFLYGFTLALNFLQAIALTSLLFTLYFMIKDFFKKDYSIQKFDIQAFQMIINVVSYLAILFVIFTYGGYRISEVFDPTTFKSLGYDVIFINDKLVNNSILIIIAIYIVLYVILELIKYNKFEKYEDKLHDIYR
jgi:hypothetical protein